MKGWLRSSLPWSRLVLDICLWTCLLSLTGGPASIFYIGYLVEILISAIAISSAGCLAAGLLSTMAYAIILVAQPGLLTLEEGLSRAAALLLTGTIAFVLIRRIEMQRRRAEALNRKLTRQMTVVHSRIEEMGRRLARAETLSHIGETASGIAHEMTNTVHGLRGFLSILRNDLSADPRYARLMTLIETGIESLDEIGEEVLSRARQTVEPAAPVDLHDLLQEVVAFVREEPARVETELICSRSIRPIFVWAGRGVLRRAFVNLLRNSLQAMPGGGRLTIRVVPQGVMQVRIEVADTGVGIPAEVRDRMFEPFVTSRAGGTGLGLALSRKAIRRCGGDIELTRTGAEGTVMTVVLPRHLVVARTAAKARAGRAPVLQQGYPS
jgi:signal transduction histidine kinase